MPTAPPHPCPAPHCGRLVYGEGRCPLHRRPSAHARGYDHAWASYTKAWLARFPWCGMRQDGQPHPEGFSRCAQQGLRVRATCTNHILAMKDGGAKLDPANHESMCGTCNRLQGIAIEGGFGR